MEAREPESGWMPVGLRRGLVFKIPIRVFPSFFIRRTTYLPAR